MTTFRSHDDAALAADVVDVGADDARFGPAWGPAEVEALGWDDLVDVTAGPECSTHVAAAEEEPPDIPEVPFSVRVASLWGSPAPQEACETSGRTAARHNGHEVAGGAGTVVAGGTGTVVAGGSDRAFVGGHAAEPGGPVILDEAQAWQRLLGLLERHSGRVVLGLTGSPGAGKTTYADYLAACCVEAAVIGLDGFQLSSSALSRMGRAARRGAPDTFDLEGYIALMRRLRRDDQHTIWAPEYRRDVDEPAAAAVAVRPSTRVVLTEGNYLLLPQQQWLEARAMCDEVWYVEVPERVRVERLVGRHYYWGRSKAQARARVTVGIDAENAHIVAGTRDRADVVVRLSLSQEEHS